VGDPVWCRRVYLALLHEVHELPADSPVLTAAEDAAADDISIRVQLLIRTLVPALGGARRELPGRLGADL
jgi:hypothetical protein